MIDRRRPAPTLRVAPRQPGIVGWLARELSELWAEADPTPPPAKVVPAAIVRVAPLPIVVGAPVVPPPALLGLGPREATTEERALRVD